MSSGGEVLSSSGALSCPPCEDGIFSYGKPSLSGGKAIELEFSVRSREHRSLSKEINLHERAADEFAGKRIDNFSLQSVFVVVRILQRFERCGVLDLRRGGTESA